ncbi:MAG: hypothetical protein EAX95_05890 [Candidatus Thorarchaeota archaeon]|nr:hypothetical protein [Candidatus Thorarchaeota archaeon]
MSKDAIVDYSRQSNVNRAYAVIVVSVTAFSLIWKYIGFQDPSTVLPINILIPSGLLLLSAVMGALSKRAIDYVPGEWEERKVWVPFKEYDEMVESFEDAYGHLFSHGADGCGICLLMPITILLGWLAIIFESSAETLFTPLIDSLLLVAIIYAIVSVAGFVLGFRAPAIDAKEFFKLPELDRDVYDFASELQYVDEIRAGLNVTLGIREGVQTIKEAEIKTHIEGLPDTVAIKVQVSRSGFAYPYLVGTAYKGNPVDAGSESFRIGTKYPALVEYSMDKNVTVMVARFNIPKRTSAVPHISSQDFRRLAVLLVSRLKANHEGTL